MKVSQSYNTRPKSFHAFCVVITAILPIAVKVQQDLELVHGGYPRIVNREGCLLSHTLPILIALRCSHGITVLSLSCYLS